MTSKYSLGQVDYAVFGLFMCISVGVGIYHAVLERIRPDVKERSHTDEYLMGGRRMPVIPVALSLLTTFLSGLTLLGTPAEFFQHGGLWILMYWMAPISFLIFALLFLPIIYHLNVTSIYEYLELRFHSPVLRRLCAGAFILNTLIYLGAVTYAPAVALNGVTDLDVWLLILLVGVSSTVYTTIGGLKAVVWADTLQAGVMYTGIGFVVVKGTIDCGGIGRVMEIASISGRIDNTFRFDPNPAQYNSVWVTICSGTSIWLALYGINQMAVQRYCSLPSLKDARKVVWITIPLYLILSTMACYIGLLVLAYFYNCNPLETGEINTHDQLVILLAVKISQSYYGMSGLFLACIFATTLSTVSSGYNSLSAVVYTDFVQPYFGDRLSAKQALLINKSVVLISGLVATGLAYAAGPLGGMIQSCIGLLGATIGPVVGLFCVGILFRGVSTRAVTVGFVGSILCCILLWLAATVENPYKGYTLPTNSSEENCHDMPFNLTRIPESYDPHFGRPDAIYFSKISAFSYAFVGLILVLVPSLILTRALPAKEEKFSCGRKHSLTLRGRPALQHQRIAKLRKNVTVPTPNPMQGLAEQKFHDYRFKLFTKAGLIGGIVFVIVISVMLVALALNEFLIRKKAKKVSPEEKSTLRNDENVFSL